MKFRNVVWDWNGTLLDDLSVGVNTLNDMLVRYGLPVVSENYYKREFGFPVYDFYLKVGFELNKESFHEISLDFVKTYDKLSADLKLTRGAVEILHYITDCGMNNYVLSALNQEELDAMLKRFGINDCFVAVYGSNNIYGSSKAECGHKLAKDCNLDADKTIMIGDTTHDAEVAKEIGFDSILYSGGHNTRERLMQHSQVIDNLMELKNFL